MEKIAGINHSMSLLHDTKTLVKCVQACYHFDVIEAHVPICRKSLENLEREILLELWKYSPNIEGEGKDAPVFTLSKYLVEYLIVSMCCWIVMFV